MMEVGSWSWEEIKNIGTRNRLVDARRSDVEYMFERISR
jgi:hypothetical protein